MHVAFLAKLSVLQYFNGQFPLSDAPARNHGRCIYQNKYPVQDDERKKLIGLLCRDAINFEVFVVRLRFRIKAKFSRFFVETVNKCFSYCISSDL